MINISIIIPTLNEEKYLNKTLKALKQQIKKGDEIIIVDSYSKDDTIKIAKKYGAKIFYISRCGIGPAKNFGAKKAKNKIIAMLDADGVPQKEWLDRIRTHFKENIEGVAGLGYYESNSKLRKVIYNLVSWCVFQFARINYHIIKLPWMPVNDSAIKKNILIRYGGLRNVVCEDLDFAKRAKGIKIKYDPKMKVILSDRRFKKEGFLKTLFLWLKSDIAILINKNKMKATSYRVVR